MATRLQDRRRKAVFDAIVRECARDLPPVELVARVAERLSSAIAGAEGGWMFFDPQTLMFTGGIRPEHPPEALSRMLRNEFADDDVLKFRELARSSRSVATLRQATGGQPERSSRYRQIMAPQGYGDEMRGVFRAGGASWGGVILVRGAAYGTFDEADSGLLDGISGHVGVALRRSLTADTPVPAKEAGTGVLILKDDDTVESQTPRAARLLRQAGQPGEARLPLPMAVYSVAHQARSAGCGSAASASARVRLASGRWLSVDAAQLSDAKAGPGRVSVVLQPARHAQLAPLTLAARGLTARERQIARLLLRGDTTERIAQRLCISRHTLRDHIKAIYAKAGVTTRPEFTALLLHEDIGM